MQGKQGNLSVVEDGECTIVAFYVLGKGEERVCGRADWFYRQFYDRK